MTQQRIDRHAGQADTIVAFERAKLIERDTGAVEHAAQEPRTHRHHAGSLTRNHASAWFEAVRIARGHQEQTLSGEAHDLRFDASAIACDDIATIADGCFATQCFEREPHHSCQASLDRERRRCSDTLHATREVRTPDGRALCRRSTHVLSAVLLEARSSPKTAPM